jgi:hypothetical protein
VITASANERACEGGSLMTRRFITGAAQAVKDSPQRASKIMEGREDLTKPRSEKNKKRSEADVSIKSASKETGGPSRP